ncbi:hypothetical protein INR49_023771 [Caranx melampygus]|nr:hypothetical protein INR49_023771 [Caranx melampygus]
MASLSHTGEKAPAQMPEPSYHSQLEKARFETSLSFLTRRFAELVNRSPDGILDLNIVAHELNAPKRRVYDVTNVLEGIQLIKKKSKNYIEWLGGKVNIDKGPELDVLVEEEKKLDELIQTCLRQIHWMCEDHHSQRFAYLTYEDVQRIPSLSEQTVIVIKAPAETKLEVPHPEESLQVHLSSTQGPIEVYICSDEPVPMEAAEASVTSDSHLNSSTNGNDSVPLSPSSSFVQLSVKDDANKTSGNDSIHTSLSDPTQQSASVTVTPSSPCQPPLNPLLKTNRTLSRLLHLWLCLSRGRTTS